jgi:FKBP-type peptidyl-prolyl cis-trans isomerase 2
MSDKKQKEAMIKKVKQVIVVGACILFVILMILSGMSSHWLTVFTVTKPGDTVVVDYTLYDVNGNPVLTSSQQTYASASAKGRDILYSKQLSMTVGQNLTKSLYPVSIYTSGKGWTKEYALFSTEYDAIDKALIGMKAGDQKRMAVPNSSMAQEWSATQLTKNGVNISDLNVGDVLAMGVSDDPDAMARNASSTTYTRVGQVTSKTNESVTVDFGYPAVDISIVSINANS